MINLEDYIKQFRHVYVSPFKPPVENYEFFKRLLPEICHCRLEFIEINSTDVYPKFIRIGDRHVCLWDNMYWDFFVGFVSSKYLVVENEKWLDFCNSLTEYMIWMFLTFRFEKNPCLSYVLGEYLKIAQDSVMNQLATDPMLNYRYGELQADIVKRLIICQEFVLFHELAHHEFEKTLYKEEFTSELIDFCRDIHAEETCSSTDFKDESYQNHLMLKMISDLDKNSKELEELCCDIKAIRRSTELTLQVLKDHDEPIQIFTDLMKKVDWVQKFQLLLGEIEFVWNLLYKEYYLNSGDSLQFAEKSLKKLKSNLSSSCVHKCVMDNIIFLHARYDFVRRFCWYRWGEKIGRKYSPKWYEIGQVPSGFTLNEKESFSVDVKKKFLDEERIIAIFLQSKITEDGVNKQDIPLRMMLGARDLHIGWGRNK